MKNEMHTVRKNTHPLGGLLTTAELERRVKPTGSHPPTDKLVMTVMETCK